MRIRALLAAALLIPISTAAGQGPPPPLTPLPPPPQPPANPVTLAKANLGKALFWDEQLSSTRTVACGTCHIPSAGGTDPRAFAGAQNAIHPGLDGIFGTPDDVGGSPGVPASAADGKYLWQATYGYRAQVTNRKTNSAIDAAYAQNLFWDGRAVSTFRDPITNAIIINVGGALENQALGPIVSDTEMAHSGRVLADAVSRVAVSKPLALAFAVPTALQTWINGRTYPQLFIEAFGSPDITAARIAMAMASYQRTLFSNQTPLDAALSGGPPLTPQEQAGQAVFAQAQCNACHGGAVLSDNAFHYIGVRPVNEDPGRFAVTNNPADQGAMRTPSLRNVAQRKTFFHNGSFSTLDQVVDFYNRGGDFNAPNKSPLIIPRNLTLQQRANLVAFISRPLIDPRAASETAPFDRPRLYSESRCQPELIGNGIPGTGGFIPAAIALEPPLAGNPSFTVAVAGALSGASATLVIDSSDPGAGPGVPGSGAFAHETITLDTGVGGVAGRGSISLTIPSDPAFIGATYFGRWYVSDPSAAGGIAISPAFRFTIFDVCPDSICPGDSNGDGVVNFDDITSVLSHWNGFGPEGDANRNGLINFDDITTVLSAFGSSCAQ